MNKGAIKITIQQKIDMALAYSGNVTKKDIAEKLGVTPSAFGQRLKTGTFTQAFLSFEYEIKSIDFNKIIVEAKSKGYKLKKAEVEQKGDFKYIIPEFQAK